MMRLAFVGTPELAAQYLRALADKHELVGVLTQPDRPRGRSGKPVPSPVKRVAQELGLPVLHPDNGSCGEACQALKQMGAELGVIVAFGEKIPCGSCGFADGEMLNVHYSLLPKLRGPAPVQHAILQGLEETGVTVQTVAPEWDEGDIILQEPVRVLPDDTCATLTARLTEVGVATLLTALDLIERGEAVRRPQDPAHATYAPAFRREDRWVRWDASADEIERRIRAFNPWPRAKTLLRGQELTILRGECEGQEANPPEIHGKVVQVDTKKGFCVACGKGRLWLTEVQASGRRPLTAEEFLRGTPVRVGEQLG